MKNYTFDENIVSDLHKDAYGFRPSAVFFREWDCLDDDGKQDLWDSLVDAVGASIREEEQRQQHAIADLEDRICFMQSTIVGATREDCVRYLHDVYNTNGDTEYLEYNLGVPYGYLSGRKSGWLA